MTGETEHNRNRRKNGMAVTEETEHNRNVIKQKTKRKKKRNKKRNARNGRKETHQKREKNGMHLMV